MNQGQSLRINGELQAGEDLVLYGQMEGKIDLQRHTLTVGAGARIQAEIVANVVIVFGSVVGRVTALERVELQAGGAMEGQLTTPKLAVAEGAVLKGTVEMPRPGGEPPLAMG